MKKQEEPQFEFIKYALTIGEACLPISQFKSFRKLLWDKYHELFRKQKRLGADKANLIEGGGVMGERNQ